VAVVAQRLIRVLCGACKQPYEPEKSTLITLGMDRDQLDHKVLYRATGCPECFNTGFRGRLGIFEIMVLNDNLKSLILKSFDANRIKTEALRSGMTTLRQDGIQKVLEGLTTIEEVLRVTQ
jgi:general secretion pathway protein E